MDEHSFDDLIKRKVGNYEDPTFDEGSLATFNKRLSAVQRISWYRRHQTEVVVVSALILFTLLNTFITSSLVTRNGNIAVSTQKSVTDNRAARVIDSLTNVVNQLQVEKISLTKQVQLETTLRIKDLYALQTAQNRLRDLSNNATEHSFATSTSDKSTMSLSGETNVIDRAGDNDHVTVDGGQHTNELINMRNSNDLNSYNNLTNVVQKPIILYASIQQSKNKTLQDNIHDKNVSAKVKNDLEKHYFSGLGINVAPHADLVVNAFTQAQLALTPRVGVTADWVVSPRFSLETSIDYLTTKFQVRDHFEECNLPEANSNWGPIQRATIATRTISSPVSIKYRSWVNPKKEVLLRATYTPYFAINQKAVVDYSSVHDYDDDVISKIQVRNIEKYYGSTLKVSAGIQHLLKAKRKLETSLFYERSIKPVGAVNKQMQLYGINIAYWYNLR